MKENSTKPVVAIGLDAAEAELIRELAAAGEMPFMRNLMAKGKWSNIESTVVIGSSSIWFTFWNGRGPNEHARYGEWRWLPDQMQMERSDGKGLEPFWRGLAEDGYRIGIFDVPYAPLLDLSDGFEVSEWGPHDIEMGHMRIPQNDVRSLLAGLPDHPYRGSPPTPHGPHDHDGTKEAGHAALEGLGRRGDAITKLLASYSPHLSVLAFSELHDGGHVLWHTHEPDHHFYRREGITAPAGIPTIRDLYAAADRELGRIFDALPDDTSFCVFSLDGMRPGRGVPMFHKGVVHAEGYAKPATWRHLGWAERRSLVFAALKRAAPEWLRRLYRDRVDVATRHRLASGTMLEDHVWSETRAFVPPCDQHGWVRVNLEGRERDGIVAAAEYEGLLDELEAKITSLTAEDGRRLVAAILRPSSDGADPLTLLVPDLIIHWDNAAHEIDIQLTEPRYQMSRIGDYRTGQHSMHAFCVTHGPISDFMPETIRLEDMSSVLLKAVQGG